MVFTHATGLCITVVIALLHVTEIRHRITRYKRYITPAASHAQTHVYQPVLRVIRWTVNGGFANMFLRSSQGYETSVLRHQMQLHLVYSPAAVISAVVSMSQSTETNVPETVCCNPLAVPQQPVSGPDSESTEPGYTVLLNGVYGPVPVPARRGPEQCAKPALARFVTLLQRLKPHGETTVPSKLGPWSHLNPVLTGKTGTRGTTSRRRYRLNDPWYHRGWYRLFSPSLRHFAHLTLPNGRWRWIG